MPLAIDIKKALVFGGERGEGLQKTQKLALFADQILVIPEGEAPAEIVIPAGYPSELKEKLFLAQERRVAVYTHRAQDADLDVLLNSEAGLFVVSDLENRTLNEKISQICRQKGILCNIIDTKDLCNVWFMSLIQTPHLSIALSTRGGAAFYSARMREEWQEEVENRDHVAAILTQLRESLPRSPDRLAVLELVYGDKKFQKLIKKQKWSEARRCAWRLSGQGEPPQL